MEPAPEARPQALVVVERDGVHRIETRDIVCEGEDWFVVFGRSDGTEVRIPIDGSKLRSTLRGRVEADLIYGGGALVAPEQYMG